MKIGLGQINLIYKDKEANKKKVSIAPKTTHKNPPTFTSLFTIIKNIPIPNKAKEIIKDIIYKNILIYFILLTFLLSGNLFISSTVKNLSSIIIY